MNRATLCRAARVFSRINVADIAGALLIGAVPVVLMWAVAGLGLVEPTTALVGGR